MVPALQGRIIRVWNVRGRNLRAVSSLYLRNYDYNQGKSSSLEQEIICEKTTGDRPEYRKKTQLGESLVKSPAMECAGPYPLPDIYQWPWHGSEVNRGSKEIFKQHQDGLNLRADRITTGSGNQHGQSEEWRSARSCSRNMATSARSSATTPWDKGLNFGPKTIFIPLPLPKMRFPTLVTHRFSTPIAWHLFYFPFSNFFLPFLPFSFPFYLFFPLLPFSSPFFLFYIYPHFLFHFSHFPPPNDISWYSLPLQNERNR